MLSGGESGPVVKPGSPADSLLLERITSREGDQMPPHGEGSPLKPDQVQLLVKWIKEGCNAPDETVPLKPSDPLGLSEACD